MVYGQNVLRLEGATKIVPSTSSDGYW